MRNIFNKNELSKSGFKYINIGQKKMKNKFHNSILRAYDIRGIIGETLNTEDAYNLGYKFFLFTRKK